MSRTDAVEALYQDMAARHRARFRSIQVREPYRCAQCETLQIFADPQSRRDREDGRHPTSIHQAAPTAQAQLPTPPSRP